LPSFPGNVHLPAPPRAQINPTPDHTTANRGEKTQVDAEPPIRLGNGEELGGDPGSHPLQYDQQASGQPTLRRSKAEAMNGMNHDWDPGQPCRPSSQDTGF